MPKWLVVTVSDYGQAELKVDADTQEEAKALAAETYEMDGLTCQIVRCELIEDRPEGEDVRLRKMGAPTLPGIE